MITKKFKSNNDEFGSNEKFLTYDLGLCASLITLGYELIDLDKSEIKKVKFIFTRAAGIDNAIHNYWNSNLKLDAHTLLDSLKRVKNQIYSI